MATRTFNTTEQSDLDDFIEEASLDPDFRHAFEDAEARAKLLRDLIRVGRISHAEVAQSIGTAKPKAMEPRPGPKRPK